MVFIYPSVQEAKNKNKCINNTSFELTKIKNNEMLNQLDSHSITVNHCNGGNFLTNAISG